MISGRTQALLVCGDAACVNQVWPDLAHVSLALAALLPARLEVLARQIPDLIDDGDLSLAVDMWKHLAACTRFQIRKDSLFARAVPRV